MNIAQNRTLLIAGAVVVVIVLLAAAFFLLGREEAPEEAPQPEEEAPEVEAPEEVAEVEVVKIGILLPQTGGLATEGQEMIKAARAAIEAVNQALEAANAPVRFEVLVADSGTDPVKALEGAQTLAQQGVALIIGTASSSALSGIIEFVNTQRIITISPSSTSPALAKDDYVFRVVGNDRGQGKALAEYVFNKGFDAVVGIVRKDPYGQGIAEAFRENFEALAGEGSVDIIYYDPNKQDLSAEVQQLAQRIQEFRDQGRNVAAFIVAFETDGLNILNNAKDIPILSEVQWFSSESIRSSAFYDYPEEVQSFAEAVKLTGTFPAIPRAAFSEQVISELEARGIVLEGFVGYAYDAALLGALAILKAGTTDADALKQALLELSKDFVGVTGLKELDPETGDLRYQDYTIWVWMDGDFADVEVYIAAEGMVVNIEAYPPVSGEGKITPVNFQDFLDEWLQQWMKIEVAVAPAPRILAA